MQIQMCEPDLPEYLGTAIKLDPICLHSIHILLVSRHLLKLK